MSIENDLLETWEINYRVGLYLLEGVEEDSLPVKPDKGRSVRSQFAHIHNVRLMWLKSGAPELLENIEKLDPDSADKGQIADQTSKSGKAVSQMVRTALDSGARIKGFKPHTAAFVGYLVSHEAHHRGMIELALRQAGKPISDKVSFGLWEWGSR